MARRVEPLRDPVAECIERIRKSLYGSPIEAIGREMEQFIVQAVTASDAREMQINEIAPPCAWVNQTLDELPTSFGHRFDFDARHIASVVSHK
jgi:hypothetical protein